MHSRTSGKLCGVPSSADLLVTKTVDNSTPSTGNTVHYTVSVTDLGPATSTGVVATDTLPSGLTFVSATTSQGSYASSTGAWNIGDLSGKLDRDTQHRSARERGPDHWYHDHKHRDRRRIDEHH